MFDLSVDQVSPFLSEISGRDKTWDFRKSQADQVAQLYKATQFQRFYERIYQCSDRLMFKLISGEDEVNLKLESVHFCRVRHCPICQWRRARMWFGRFVNTLPKMLEDYPSARFLHLTLTVRNCDVGSLRTTLTDMNKAWQRLTRRKEFKPVLGWVKAVEFTRNTDSDSPWFDTVHPHFHALLMVKASYFTGRSYVSHEQWVKTWRECLRVDYDPSVSVQAIKPKTKRPSSVIPPLAGMPDNALPLTIGEDGFLHSIESASQLPKLSNEMISAVCEVVKYAVKPQDLVIGGEWLLTLTEQLRGTKAIALGGVIRDYVKEPDEDDEELIVAGLESDDTTIGDVEPAFVVFGWRERLKRYQLNAG